MPREVIRPRILSQARGTLHVILRARLSCRCTVHPLNTLRRPWTNAAVAGYNQFGSQESTRTIFQGVCFGTSQFY